MQILEENPSPKKLLLEISKIANKNGYIVISIRNLFSWYGINFLLRLRKQQVPHFGPHKPLNPILFISYIKRHFKIINSYGITPLPNMVGRKVLNPFLKYFCKINVLICKPKKYD